MKWKKINKKISNSKHKAPGNSAERGIPLLTTEMTFTFELPDSEFNRDKGSKFWSKIVLS